LLSTLANLRAADLAAVLGELAPKRRIEVASGLNDERLADVLEEMDESDRVSLLAELEGERAADVLGEMDPDDAADLLREIGEERANALLELMEPEDAEDVLRLMTYEDYSAGGMMTTEPIVLTANSTVADALASVRQKEISPALASQIYICRQPTETPTGRFIGVVHYQRLLREPPATLLGSIVDHDSIVEDFVHVAPGATICGQVKIGKKSFIGANATILPRLTIGENSIIGAGSVVTKNIPDNVVAYGSPAKVISRNKI
jgi:Mg/Co/Ni transporter MgtE